MTTAEIGIIGGSTLYKMDGLEDIWEVAFSTPFGDPSDAIVTGNLDGVPVAFLPRHGSSHTLGPAEIPARANIWALKSLGVKTIIAVCTCGSFKKEIAPGHLVIPDQTIDKTTQRENSFFTDGVVAHVPFAEPFCNELRAVLNTAATNAGATVHPTGTYVCMEGPAFSSRAESRLHKEWGADVIGMTALPEAKLAREAEICYAVVACVTDYDAWHEDEAPVTLEMIIEVMKKNATQTSKLIRLAVSRIDRERACDCHDAMSGGFLTDQAAITEEARDRLDLIIRRYVD
jgi:5'-methylthioadenosine phosphorylase